MRITAISLSNFKRINKIELKPEDGSLIIVGGWNEDGKSSFFDGLTAAFRGKAEMPPKPIREGEDAADFLIELEGGEYQLKRRLTAGGTHSLELKHNGGKVSSPQKVLDALIGKRFLDPLKFARSSEKEQREMLLDVVELDLDLALWAKNRKQAFDKRTEVGRDLRRYRAEYEGMGEPEAVGEIIPTDRLVKELNELLDKSAKSRQAEGDLADDLADFKRLGKEIEGLEEKLERTRAQIEDKKIHQANVKNRGAERRVEVEAFDVPGITKRIQEVKDSISTSADSNRAAAAAEAKQEQYNRAKALADEAKSVSDSLTAELENMDAMKATALENAVMPIEGLDIGEDHVLFKGQPLSQASGAGQLRVSLAIAMSLSPSLQDIWVKDGSLLDDRSLELIRTFAEEKGYRVWLERVGNKDPGAIIIEDGGLRDPAEPVGEPEPEPEPEVEPF